MSVKFTSACAGDIGVTIGNKSLAGSSQDEVVAMAFIHRTNMLINQVNVYNVRAGGDPVRFPNLAAALTFMTDIAHCMEAYDNGLLQTKPEDYARGKALAAELNYRYDPFSTADVKKVLGKAFLEGRIT